MTDGSASVAPPPGGAAAKRFLVFVVGSVAGVAISWALLGLGGRTRLGGIPVFYLAMAAGLLLGHWATARIADRELWRAIGLSREALTPRALATGAALGAVAVGLPSLLLLAVGWLRIEPSAAGQWGRAALLTLIGLLPAALWEELFSRGYLFALVCERLGARRAIVATSGVFGLLHLQNAGATTQSIALVTLAGIFLGTIRVATGSLYASWAAHVAWNFVMSGVFHAAVSGVGMAAPNYRTVDAGPDWATGGGWGPEGGLVTAAALVVGIIVILRRQRRRT